MYKQAAAIAALLVLSTGTQTGVSGQNGLRGVWRIAHVTIDGAQAQTIANPQPSLVILAGQHYSRTELHTDRPRPTLGSSGSATAEQLRAVWGPFQAEAGTYEVRDNVLTLHPEVAKSPAAMAGGAYLSNTFKLAGDTLWISSVRNEKGPLAQPVRIKLVRVE